MCFGLWGCSGESGPLPSPSRDCACSTHPAAPQPSAPSCPLGLPLIPFTHWCLSPGDQCPSSAQGPALSLQTLGPAPGRMAGRCPRLGRAAVPPASPQSPRPTLPRKLPGAIQLQALAWKHPWTWPQCLNERARAPYIRSYLGAFSSLPPPRETTWHALSRDAASLGLCPCPVTGWPCPGSPQSPPSLLLPFSPCPAGRPLSHLWALSSPSPRQAPHWGLPRSVSDSEARPGEGV